MGKSQRDQGKRYELVVVKWFRDVLGIKARTTRQVDGSLTADVLLPHAPGLHVEVKSRHRLAAQRFMDQAVKDADGRALPVVMMQEIAGPGESKRPLLMMIRANDFGRIRVQLMEAQCLQNDQRNAERTGFLG